MSKATTSLCKSSQQYRDNPKRRTYATPWHKDHPDLARTVVSKCHARVKELAFVALGGYRCVRCGYDADRRALQIDHVEGGGIAHRRTFGNSSYSFYRYVANFTAQFQVLCANSNIIKKISNREFGKRFLGE